MVLFFVFDEPKKTRNPKTIASTLAFMLGKDEGRLLRVKPNEVEPLREALHNQASRRSVCFPSVPRWVQ